MKDFTLKNIFKYWIKLWPVTVVLFVIGAIIGVCNMRSLQQIYQSESSILVRNSSSEALAADYVAIANSELLSGKIAVENNKYSDCNALASNVGNVVKITLECTDLGLVDDFTSVVVSEFNNVLESVYGNDNIKTTILSSNQEAQPTISQKDKLVKLAIPIIAALACSFIVALIGFDIKNSKHGK